MVTLIHGEARLFQFASGTDATVFLLLELQAQGLANRREASAAGCDPRARCGCVVLHCNPADGTGGSRQPVFIACEWWCLGKLYPGSRRVPLCSGNRPMLTLDDEKRFTGWNERAGKANSLSTLGGSAVRKTLRPRQITARYLGITRV